MLLAETDLFCMLPLGCLDSRLVVEYLRELWEKMISEMNYIKGECIH